VEAPYAHTADGGRDRSRLRRTTLFVVSLLAAAAASSSPAAAATSPCKHTRSAGLSTTQAAHALGCLVDLQRARSGLRPLRTNPALRAAAIAHSQDMAAHDVFGHTGTDGSTMPTRVRRTGYLRDAHAWWLGETLVWGSGGDATPAALFASLMASPPHRAILLAGRFSQFGIGLVHGGPTSDDADAVTVTIDVGRRSG